MTTPDQLPDLSILVCSIKTRRHFLDRLLQVLAPQIAAAAGAVELLIDTDDGEQSIGFKRQGLLGRSTGRYVCSIDDDDLITADYLVRILFAIHSVPAPDCIGFKVWRTQDGKPWGYAIHSNRFARFGHDYIPGDDVHVFYRTPNHLNPVRRELALATGFKSIDKGEDRDYAARLKPLLKTEVFIDAFLYEYEFRTAGNRPGERVHAQNGSR